MTTSKLPLYLRFKSLFIEGGVSLHQQSTRNFLVMNKMAFECSALEVGRIVKDLLKQFDFLFKEVLVNCYRISLCPTVSEPRHYGRLIGCTLNNASLFVTNQNVLRCNCLELTPYNIPGKRELLEWVKFGATRNLPRLLVSAIHPTPQCYSILSELKKWSTESRMDPDFEMRIVLADLNTAFSITLKMAKQHSHALYCPQRCLKLVFSQDLEYNIFNVQNVECPIHRMI
uniref:Uncharacterized protein n=1 Tax=Ditylenchus dipsaci TaxID=166011 RepID=A0A915DHD4_9BILA